MPLYDFSEDGIVTVDGDGFTVVAGSGYPFKNVAEDLGNGFIRLHHVVKHPTLGEITVAFQDIPA